MSISVEKLCDRGTLGAAAVLLAVPALAGGGLYSRSRVLIQLAAAAIAGMWATRALLVPAPGPLPVRLTAFTAIALALLVLLLLPIVPLPPTVVGLLSPRAFEVFTTALPAWPLRAPFADAVAAPDRWPPLGVAEWLPFPASWRPLSLVPYESARALSLGASYVVVGAVVALYPWPHEMRALTFLIGVLAALGVCQALYAFLQQSTGGQRIFWYQCPPQATCMGTYLNRNHFAGLLEMTWPLLVARAVMAWRARDPDPLEGRAQNGGLRSVAHLLGRLAQPAASRALILWGLVLLVLAALAGSGSRSAFAATAGSLALTTGMRRATGARTRVLIAGSVALLAGFWLMFPQFTRRLGSGDIARAAIAADTVEMISAFPLAGVGLGNFAAGFPLYRARTVERWAFGVDVDHAHNDYLEWLAEVGVPAACLTLALLLALGRGVAHARAAPAADAVLLWGLAAGTLALLLHGLTDFNLHVPANALVFAFLIGGLVRLIRREGASGPFAGGRGGVSLCLSRRPRRLAAAATLVISLCWLGAVWQRGTAEAAFRRVEPDSPLRSLLVPVQPMSGEPALASVQRAALVLPAAPDVQMSLAHQLQAVRPGDSAAAIRALVGAVWAAPVRAEALFELARLLGGTPEQRRALVDRAAALAPYEPRLGLAIASWYLEHWDALPGDARVRARQLTDRMLAQSARIPRLGGQRQATLDAYRRIAGRDAATPRAVSGERVAVRSE